MPDPDLDTLRGQWQSAKKLLAQNNPANPQVKQLLKGFDQGLGPVLDKLMAAGKAGKSADLKKYGEQAVKVLKDYETKLKAVPKEAWGGDGMTTKTRVSREWALATLDALRVIIAKAMQRSEAKAKTNAK
ncbi:MAG: hypothetical protein M3N95_07430 [Actinomycetota bacterium]|nr:hypothetical protein [Actinomycetota bacterium]